jgi:choline kinase
MTNRVYFLSLKSPSSSQGINTILVRFYGKSNIIIQREKEIEIAKLLASKKLAPKWYLSFGNGRIEEYLDCQSVPAPLFRSLPTASEIAMNLARLHQLLPDLVKNGIFPAQENHIWRLFDERRHFASDAFQIILRHYEQVSRSSPELADEEDLSRLTMLQNIQSWNPFHSEKVDILKEAILKVNSPLVYAHCDVHHGNVIKMKTSTDVVTAATPPASPLISDSISSPDHLKGANDSASAFSIIDFEYGIPTGRGYDLANFFCEFCGDYDSADQTPAHLMDFSLYPDEESRRLIFQSYCLAIDWEGSEKTPLEKTLESLEAEVRVYLPLAHLQWAHWGVIKAADEIQRGVVSSFDYLRYAYQRYAQWHQEILKQHPHRTVGAAQTVFPL